MSSEIINLAATVFNNIPSFSGILYYTSPNGNNDNTGLSLNDPLASIDVAYNKCLADSGSGVYVTTGTYDQSSNGVGGVELDTNGVTLFIEDGVVINNTNTADNGVVLNFTAARNYVYANGTVIVAKGEDVSANSDAVRFGAGSSLCVMRGILTNVQNVATATGIKFTGGALSNLVFGRESLIGVVQGAGAGTCIYFENSIFCGVFRTSMGNADIGVRFGNSALRCQVNDDSVIGICDTGILLNAGAMNNLLPTKFYNNAVNIADNSGNATNNATQQFPTVHHEQIHPLSNGEGGANGPVSISNLTTNDAGGTRSDQYFWGDITPVVLPDVIVTNWLNTGIYVHAETFNKIMQWQIMYTHNDFVSVQNGGNDWDAGEIVFTVADPTIFQMDDLVWLTGNNRPAGEILKVTNVGTTVDCVSEARASFVGGLRYDYDGDPSANKMYLAFRATDPRFVGFCGDYSASSARDHERWLWHLAKETAAGAAMLARALNADDDTNASMGMRAIYEA